MYCIWLTNQLYHNVYILIQNLHNVTAAILCATLLEGLSTLQSHNFPNIIILKQAPALQWLKLG